MTLTAAQRTEPKTASPSCIDLLARLSELADGRSNVVLRDAVDAVAGWLSGGPVPSTGQRWAVMSFCMDQLEGQDAVRNLDESGAPMPLEMMFVALDLIDDLNHLEAP
jgi:hypothetical protein